MNYQIREIAGMIEASCPVVVDRTINALLTDSRAIAVPGDTLFFAFQTQTNDGHKYIGDLYRMGVRNFVISKSLPEYKQMEGANFLLVDNPLKALQQVAAYHRRRFSMPVIGITGSNGKTVVKELLYQLIHADFNIVRSPRSYNSQIGVPLSVWEMDKRHTLGIFEAGISYPHEMDALRPMIAPTIGVITNIGEAHQENFKSVQEKCLEKLSLFTDADVILYNADDQLITSALEASGLSCKAAGWSRRDADATLFVNKIEKGATTTRLRCTMAGITHDYVIPFTDNGFIEDIIHCIAVMAYLKPSTLTDRDASFASLEPVAMRLEVKQGVNGCQLINDSYNSDVNSLSVALNFQHSRKAGKTLKSTVILSDILQSGFPLQLLYQHVAEQLRRKHVGRIIGIGPDISAHVSLFEGMEKDFYPSTEAFIKQFKQQQFQNELILIKGSRSFHFEQITELLVKKVHETILEVNLDAIVHNFNYYRSRLRPQTKISCMVKAFGYGVGSFEIAKTLQERQCDYLAVAVADEGADLRKEGITIPILVMNPELSSFQMLFDNRLEPEVYSFRLLDALIRETERRGITSFPVHVKIDTGMHRLGFDPGELPALARRLKMQSGLTVRSVFSHLAGSDSPALDDFTDAQLKLFAKSVDAFEAELGYPVMRHVLNSAGAERFVEHQMDMVRIGISLYGVSGSGTAKDLQCVCTLTTTILQIRRVPAGDSIGYGRMTFLQKDSMIATLPVGYADGLNRLLSNGVGEVIAGGKRCPIVGNICMDACMIDVTGVDVNEGDSVILFNDKLTVNEIAAKVNTIPYEILTSISPRVKRIYFMS